ncbi:MAG: PaREP1 family protein [Sulfolobaceae archaeon]
MRNSAGKAYQAVKAYVAGISVDYRDLLLKYCPGRKKISPIKVVEKVDWIIAIMPSNRLREIATIIGDKELRFITEIALDLHEFQYNGFDKDVEISRYNKEEFVKKDIMLVIEFIKKSKLSHLVT